MTTIIFTYRNRNTYSVKNCLDSLKQQSNKAFKVVLVNYGSNEKYSSLINDLVNQYEFASIINCKTQGELWCKSRAINIVLKQCDTPYVFVGDVDMVFHPEFVQKLDLFKKEKTATYFQVGFLNKEESTLAKTFKEYKIAFKSTAGATGMTFYNKSDLLGINGYDEFYHGWGSEDTDVHIRLINAGTAVNFFDDEVLMLHQWHPKQYRTKDSLEPFHSHLEQINAEYLRFTESTKKTKANTEFDFGSYLDSDYEALNQPELVFKLTNQRHMVKGFIKRVLISQNNKVVKLKITKDPEYKSIKQALKKMFNKKPMVFLSMQEANDLLLETIVSKNRNSAYRYQYNQSTQTIDLTIKL